MERNNDVFTVRIIFNNCVKDIIMVSIGANNKASLHPLVFFLQFKFSPFITITVCNSFPVKLRRHMTLALEKKTKTISKHWRTTRSQTGRTPGCQQCQTIRERAQTRRMVEILLPAVDLVGSPVPEFLSCLDEPSGLAGMAGCVVGVCPVSVSPGRGSERKKEGGRWWAV